MTNQSRPVVVRTRFMFLLVSVCLAGAGCLNRSGLSAASNAEDDPKVLALTAGGGISSAPLQLQELTNACVANQVLNAFQVTNNGTASVALSDISIKMWVDDTTAAQQIVTDVNYGGCATSGPSCVHQVTGVKATVTPISHACGPDANHQANWELTISTTDTTTLAAGGRWTNLQTGTHLGNYANFTPGTNKWFSPCLGGSYVSDPHYALYYKGDLVFASGVNTPSCRGPHGTQPLTGYRTPEIASAPLVGPVPPETSIELSVALPVRNQAALKAFIRGASDPSQPSTYRHFLTPEQYAATYGPLASDYQKVIDWATAAGFTVTRTYPSHTSVFLQGTAATVEKALFVNLNHYSRPDGTQFYAADREPSLNLVPAVLRVSGLDDLYVPKPNVSPSDPHLFGVADLHGTYAYCHPDILGAGQTIAILSYAAYRDEDVEHYKARIHDVTFGTVEKVSVEGRSTASDPNMGAGMGEADLDVQMAIGMAPSANIIMYVMQGVPLNGTPTAAEKRACTTSTNAALTHIANTQPLALQISNSWGLCNDSATRQAVDQLAALGVSIFFPSGDEGSHDVDVAEWSLNMDNVTLVGGTNPIVNSTKTAVDHEEAWSGSSGGILKTVGLPYYQEGVSGLVSTAHRNYPDVAAYGTNVEYFYGNPTLMEVASGTSVSVPLWAGFMALVNSAIPNSTGFGFLNPTIYNIAQSSDYGDTFNDIKIGSTPTTIKNLPGQPTYNAISGYDATTGWGSPKCGLIDKLTAPSAGCTYKFWYPDCDNDGYGDAKGAFIYSCTEPTTTPACPNGSNGTYVNNNGDCCDKDASTHPGQDQYFTSANACGSFDYNCDQYQTQEIHGPTGCFGVGSCVPNSAHTDCEWTGLPARCNGSATSFHTAPCGQQWTLDTETCLKSSIGYCVSAGNGGPGGTQACN